MWPCERDLHRTVLFGSSHRDLRSQLSSFLLHFVGSSYLPAGCISSAIQRSSRICSISQQSDHRDGAAVDSRSLLETMPKGAANNRRRVLV